MPLRAAHTAPTHSGAGRIVSLRLRPLSLAERGVETPTVSLHDLLAGGGSAIEGKTDVTLADYVHEIVDSGFPGIRRRSGRARRLHASAPLSNALASRPSMRAEHLLWLRDQIGDDLIDAVVINTGPQAYRRQDGVAVVPAALLGA